MNREPPPPAEPELPDAVQRFLDGFTEPEVRDEFAAEARAMIARDPDQTGERILARLLNIKGA